MSETIEELQARIAKMEEINEKANAEAKSRRLENKELKDMLAKFEGIDPDKFKEMQTVAERAEQERLKQAGEFEKALEQGLHSLKSENEKLKEIIGGKDSRLAEVLIDNTILAAIDGKAVNNNQVLKLLRENVKLDGDAAIVLDGDSPKLDEKGNLLSVKDYALSFLAENAHLARPSGGGSGSQGNTGANTGARTIKRSEFGALKPSDQVAYLKEGGQVAD